MIKKQQDTIYIASDHGGFELKTFLVGKLMSHSYTVYDLGPNDYNPDDDYPDYTKKLAERVTGDPGQPRGIVICKNGVGVSVYANKFKGLRCAVSWNSEHTKSARNDDNINILALPADYISKDIAWEITKVFLETPFSNEERHVRRLKKVGE